MFERFSEEARQVVVWAQEEARGLNHSYIGTEHILLGVLRAEEHMGGEQPLHSLGLSLEDVRRDIRRIVGSSDEPPPEAIPFTPRAKKVLELALREALSLGHNWIGPEHIVLGLVRENEGVASRILRDFDADAEKVRSRVTHRLPPQPAGRVVTFPGAPGMPRPLEVEWLPGLGRLLEQLGREIRQELGREPDAGDLLLAIACARPSVAVQALEALGLELDALWGTLERIRQREAEEAQALARRIGELQAQKHEALEQGNYEAAAKARDAERELAQQRVAAQRLDPGVLDEFRRRLGLTGQNPPAAEGD